MKLLKEITEKDLGISNQEILEQTYRLRKSARGILLNEKGEVSLQHVTKWDYYKLPGGGVDAGETEREALAREMLEEVGCEIVIEQELGIIIEYRSADNLLHISYGYICRMKGEMGKPQYEKGEIADGFEPVWKTFDEALLLMDKRSSEDLYRPKFIITREKAFLEEAKRVLDQKNVFIKNK